MTPIVCIFSLLVLVSCLRMQLSHQAKRRQRQSTWPTRLTLGRAATAHSGDVVPAARVAARRSPNVIWDLDDQ
jgi:hypothetical protein